MWKFSVFPRHSAATHMFDPWRRLSPSSHKHWECVACWRRSAQGGPIESFHCSDTHTILTLPAAHEPDGVPMATQFVNGEPPDRNCPRCCWALLCQIAGGTKERHDSGADSETDIWPFLWQWLDSEEPPLTLLSAVNRHDLETDGLGAYLMWSRGNKLIHWPMKMKVFFSFCDLTLNVIDGRMKKSYLKAFRKEAFTIFIVFTSFQQSVTDESITKSIKCFSSDLIRTLFFTKKTTGFKLFLHWNTYQFIYDSLFL